ncbi:lysozyme [Volucribacter psittacicida]|uniref:Lysozyme n=1 Tax=Volucribacter psittacicida TaxID=203482 RepID=A0A4R1FX23_9PAST|nr:lysozyme [Volucribacter psittacicida]TCJ98830.1 lysozyme [Volucribacter psittacicida]
MKLTKKIIATCAVSSIVALVVANYPSSQLRTSEQGLLVIGNAESCRQQPYYCPAGILTVGIGSTAQTGQPIQQRQYSEAEIAERFANDVRQAEQCVNRYANGKAMPQGAFDALVSISFNVGCGKMRQSTLFKMANQGYTPEMCNQFERWVYSNGKKLNGLVKRRQQEKALCLQEGN